MTMNKIMKAISELKGVYPYAEPSIIEQISTGNLESWHGTNDLALNTGNFRLLCTKREFKETLEQLPTNFGASCSYDDYIAEFWSKAPDGAEYFSPESRVFYNTYFKNVTSNSYSKFCPVKDSSWVYVRGQISKERALIKKPGTTIKKPEQTKPVYTQAMSNKGEAIPVGSTVVHSLNGEKCEVILPADRGGYYVLISNGGYLCETRRNLKPIDTRTPKEKLFDQINAVPRIHIEDANNLVSDIVNGKIHGVKWVGE